MGENRADRITETRCVVCGDDSEGGQCDDCGAPMCGPCIVAIGAALCSECYEDPDEDNVPSADHQRDDR